MPAAECVCWWFFGAVYVLQSAQLGCSMGTDTTHGCNYPGASTLHDRCLHLFAVDLGAQSVPDDQKVNLGACLLRSALSVWAHNFSRLFLSGAPIPGLDDPGAEQLPRFRSDLTPAGE